MPQARNLRDAIKNLDTEPLTNGRFKDFFVNTTDARGGDDANYVLREDLEESKQDSKHYLFMGAKGCGKSTELMRLQLSLPDFLVVTFSVRNELDLYHFTHTELLIATMKKLFEAVHINNLEIDEKYLQPVLSWVDKIDTEITNTTGLGVETKAGVKAKAGFLGLFNVFAELTSRAKYDTQVKETIHKVGDNVVSQLIFNCNILITEIKNALASMNKGLLVIIEDLDKIDLKSGEELFFNYSSRLVALNMNTIYTYPLSLKYHSRANIALTAFDNAFLLPMIKTHTKSGAPYLEGGQLELKTILEKRMAPDLFETEELMMKFIRYSGGVVLDLFRSVRDASYAAMSRDRQKINERDWEKAFYRTLDNYRSMISDRIEGNNVIVKAGDYFSALKMVAENENKEPENTREELELRQNLCILSYNGEGWIDVHPIVKEILIQKQLIDASYRIQ